MLVYSANGMADTVIISTPNVSSSIGEELCIPIQIKNFDNIVSFQLALRWDPSILNFTSIVNTTLRDVREGSTQADEGILRLLWFDSALSPSTLEDLESIVEVCFEPNVTQPTSTEINITSIENLQIEITNTNNELVPYTIQNGNINLTVAPPCDLSENCVSNINLAFVPGMTIEPNEMISNYEEVINCLGVEEDEIYVLVLNNENAQIERNLTIDCDNLYEEVEVALIHKANPNTASINSFIEICRPSIKLDIPDNYSSCILTTGSCLSTSLCKDIVVDVDSLFTTVLYHDLLNFIPACDVQFFTPYSSITHTDRNGFELSCFEYQDQISIPISAVRTLETGDEVVLQLCTSVINLQNYEDQCTNQSVPDDEIMVNIASPTSVNLTINGKTLNQRGPTLYTINSTDVIDRDNLIEINPNPPSLSNNISTLDLVMMYKAIISQESTPTMAIAMDLDWSGSLTTKDLLILRKNIIGIENIIHTGKQFMVETASDFSDFDLFDFNNNFYQHSFDQANIDPTEGFNFEIFNYGDVSGAASDYHKTNGIEPIDVALSIKDQSVEANQILNIPVQIKSPQQITALSLMLKTHNLVINHLDHPYSNSLLQYHQSNPQSLGLSFLSPEKQLPFEMIISVTPLVSGRLSEMLEIDSYLLPEVVIEDQETGLLHLSWYNEDNHDKVDEICFYPNPTSEYLHLDIPADYINGSIKIYSILGQEIYESTIVDEEMKINLTKIATKGIHIVRLQKEELKETFRIIVE